MEHEHDDEQHDHDHAAQQRHDQERQLVEHQHIAVSRAYAATVRNSFAVVALLTQLAATSAPADRYFGRLKMSGLRIRYETLQIERRYWSHQLLPDQAMHLLFFTEDAYRQWASAYPEDPWLASSGYNMAQVYEQLPGTAARDRAVALLVFVKSQFPKSTYAQKSRDQLHRGIAVKPVPAWAIVPPATPSPPASALPSATPSATPSSGPTAYPQARPTAAR